MRLGVLTLVVLLAAAAPAAAAEREIRIGRTAVTGIGSFRPLADPSVAAAVRAFGPASSQRATGDVCTATWSGLRLTLGFASYGAREPDETACDAGRAQTFSVRGRGFATSAGLRVGDRVSRLRRLHPRAVRHPDGYWLRTATSPFGEGADYAVVRARLRSGRVSALAGWIGAAGE